MSERPHILVLGAGSVGRRHLRNLVQLGCRVSAMDPRPDRIAEAASEVTLERSYAALEPALADAAAFDGVAVCSPPSFHVEQGARSLQLGLPVLMEKPLTTSSQAALPLLAAAAAARAPLLLGYTYRWWQPLRELRRRIAEGEVGRVLHVRCCMSAHLADWHPWEAYQDFFMASRELGGGALLDESHFVDLMLWMFGVPERVFARVERLSALDIDTDDNVDALLEYDAGLRVSIHLDLFGRPHEKYITVSGETGTLHWSFDPNSIRLGREAAQQWEDTVYQGERNDMFVEVAREFLEVVAGRAAPTATVQDGLDVLRVLDAMRASSASGTVTAVEAVPFTTASASSR